MQQNPQALAHDLRETLCTYLETAYRLSHPALVEERARLLRSDKVIGQDPFIETTPRFPTGAWLHDINLPWLPSELSDLTRLGLTTGQFALYKHQEDAIRAAWDDNGKPQDLIVASGTGSGKTECFYLPILADILREALTWAAPQGRAVRGEWQQGQWQHSRQHESRPAAMRAIVLYPMNALVNDQLRRLRKMLNSDEAQQWQKTHLKNNQIYFGRYTGQTELAGEPDDARRRTRWKQYLSEVEEGWHNVGDEIRAAGGWPRPDGSEMLGRWDMQQAPPDILITNYSMLEYMLVRPIEAGIFESTRAWLASSPSNVLTLVLDEAHSYSGARGTEVAYLIRRLYERLGATEHQIRCVATSASLGETPEELQRVTTFMGELFGHAPDRFQLIQAARGSDVPIGFVPTEALLHAFVTFQNTLNQGVDQGDDEVESLGKAANRLLGDLRLPADSADVSSDSADESQQLYQSLKEHPAVLALRQLTAGKARPFSEVAETLWQQLGSASQRSQATAALLAVGAYARPRGVSRPDVPPLIPSRMHLMFRGVPGLWACLNPQCTEVVVTDLTRPCGRLFTEPRIWCECGARVLEVFSCRVCGLLFLGGIPEDSGTSGRLWPYQSTLDGGLQDYDKYRVFAVENPNDDDWQEEIRSFHSTEILSDTTPDGRVVWTKGTGNGAWRPNSCPRCHSHKSAKRQIIEPFRTTGPQQLAVLVQQAFRLQPPRVQKTSVPVVAAKQPRFFRSAQNAMVTPPLVNPNSGRKALVFSDGRQDAAMLAGDLTFNHARDLFRQVMLYAQHDYLMDNSNQLLAVHELRQRIMDVSIKRGIDPSLGEIDHFWEQLKTNAQAARQKAHPYIDAYLRREIADRQVGVESLALARWTISAEEVDFAEIPALEPFTQLETLGLINAVVRILSWENVLLPEDLNPESWPSELVDLFYKRVVIRPPMEASDNFLWSSDKINRLTRYLEAVVKTANFPGGVRNLMDRLWDEYLEGFALVTVTGKRTGWGLPINRLTLAPMPEQVFVCKDCAYVSADTYQFICLRCQGECAQTHRDQVMALRHNYYRKLSEMALEGGKYPDPFPMAVLEHTAQISATDAANRERYFQDQFIQAGGHQEDPMAKSVDILSVTTTMEMGIDIGDLTTVGLHNMPPTVANYQQRAGRAGRRSDGVAAVITFARDRSHDQYYFRHVAEIVTGRVRIPRIHLDNAVIARRHVYALVLQRFFANVVQSSSGSNLFGAFGTVATFKQDNPSQWAELRRMIHETAFGPEIQNASQQIVPNFAAQVDDWVQGLPKELEKKLENADESSDLLTVLINCGILPRYAFPVDLVALWTREPNRYNRGEEVQRDLQIALSEYAPGGEVVIDGKIYLSAGLFTPFTDSAQYRACAWYYECPACRNVVVSDIFTNTPPWTVCPMCQMSIAQEPGKRPQPAISPSGFRTDWHERAKKYRGGNRERSGYSSAAQLVAGESADKGHSLYQGRLFVHHREGNLNMVNHGPKDQSSPGFWICPVCGRNLRTKAEVHRWPDHDHKVCNGRPQEQSILLHGFRSFVALMAVVFPSTMEVGLHREHRASPGGRGAWLSFATALLQAAATHLQVDAGELQVGVRPWRDPNGRNMAEAFLYDTLPNGAGYAEEVMQDLDAILKRARDISQGCPRQCETACYSCLMDYGNQREHAILDRHLAADMINFVLDGIEPTFTRDRQRNALEKLRPFLTHAVLELEADRDGTIIPGLLSIPNLDDISIWPTHTLRVPPDNQLAVAIDTNTKPIYVSEFDLTRRPFWVWNQISLGKRGWLS